MSCSLRAFRRTSTGSSAVHTCVHRHADVDLKVQPCVMLGFRTNAPRTEQRRYNRKVCTSLQETCVRDPPAQHPPICASDFCVPQFMCTQMNTGAILLACRQRCQALIGALSKDFTQKVWYIVVHCWMFLAAIWCLSERCQRRMNYGISPACAAPLHPQRPPDTC